MGVSWRKMTGRSKVASGSLGRTLERGSLQAHGGMGESQRVGDLRKQHFQRHMEEMGDCGKGEGCLRGG